MKSHSLCLLLLVVWSLNLPAEDVVVIAAAQKGLPPQEKKGVVQEYTGEELLMLGPGERKTSIPGERVLEIRSTWTKTERAGDEFRRQGKLSEAIEAYRSAIIEERRAWAARKIQAKLLACYEWNDQPELAGEEFLSLVKQDSSTPYFFAIPLAWRTASANAVLLEKARKWMDAKANPAANLLGASWLLTGDERQKATNVLQGLSSDLDPRVASLATAQLWRSKLVTATAEDLARWQQHLSRVPVAVQQGPLLLIGQTQQRLKFSEDANVSFLQAALTPQPRETLAIDGFLAAAKLFEQQSRFTDAARLYREIQTTNPVAANVLKVGERLDSLEKRPTTNK